MSKVEMHEDVVNMDKGECIDCSKLKCGTHQFIVTYEGNTWNVEVKRDCSSSYIYRWNHTEAGISRSYAETEPAWSVFGAEARLYGDLLLHLEEIEAAIHFLRGFRMQTHLDVKEW